MRAAATPARPSRAKRGAVAANLGRHLLLEPVRDWGRHFGAHWIAIGSLVLLLTLGSLLGLAGLVLRQATLAQSREAAVINVYLRDDASAHAVAALRGRLQATAGVASVSYTSKEDALRNASQRPGLGQLAAEVGSNPFPASLDVQARSLQDVSRVAALAAADPAADASRPTSYDKGAYDRVESALHWLAIAAGSFLLIFGLVAVGVSANAVRASVLSRGQEVRIMRLVGSPRWMISGPFLVEGAVSGTVAGAISGAIVAFLGVAALRSGPAQLAQFAPGVTPEVVAVVASGTLVAGVVLAACASTLAITRHLA